MPRVQAPQSLLPNQSSELLISTFILLQSAGRSIASPRFLCWPHLSDPPRHHRADIAIRPHTSSNSSVSFCKPSFLFHLPYDLPLCVICEPKSKSADGPSDRTIRALNSSIATLFTFYQRDYPQESYRTHNRSDKRTDETSIGRYSQ